MTAKYKNDFFRITEPYYLLEAGMTQCIIPALFMQPGMLHMLLVTGNIIRLVQAVREEGRDSDRWLCKRGIRQINMGKLYQKGDRMKENVFKGCKIAVTGKLKYFTRNEINKEILEAGAKPCASVTGRTDFVICGVKPGRKLARAEESGIPVLTEEQFMKMMTGGQGPGYPVSREKCGRCSACQMVTKDISGRLLDREEVYYQCIAMSEDICRTGSCSGSDKPDEP